MKIKLRTLKNLIHEAMYTISPKPPVRVSKLQRHPAYSQDQPACHVKLTADWSDMKLRDQKVVGNDYGVNPASPDPQHAYALNKIIEKFSDIQYAYDYTDSKNPELIFHIWIDDVLWANLGKDDPIGTRRDLVSALSQMYTVIDDDPEPKNAGKSGPYR